MKRSFIVFYMKKIIFLFSFLTVLTTQGVVVLEYDIKNLNGTQSLPVFPIVDKLNTSSLFFSGYENGFADIGQISAYNWQISNTIESVTPAGQNYNFLIDTPLGLKYDFSNATIMFGASVQFAGNMAVFANDQLIGNIDLGSNGNFQTHTLSLEPLSVQTTPVEMKLVGWGVNDPGYMGLDTGIIPGTYSNLLIENVTITGSPIPEPKYYALIASVFLLGFVIYKKL